MAKTMNTVAHCDIFFILIFRKRGRSISNCAGLQILLQHSATTRCKSGRCTLFSGLCSGNSLVISFTSWPVIISKYSHVNRQNMLLNRQMKWPSKFHKYLSHNLPCTSAKITFAPSLLCMCRKISYTFLQNCYKVQEHVSYPCKVKGGFSRVLFGLRISIETSTICFEKQAENLPYIAICLWEALPLYIIAERLSVWSKFCIASRR